MKRSPHKSKNGYALMVAMLMLVLGAALVVWMYSLLSSSTGVARNVQRGDRAQMAADSGLSCAMHYLKSVTSARRLMGMTDGAVLSDLATALNTAKTQNGINAGVISYNSTTTVLDMGQVNLVDGAIAADGSRIATDTSSYHPIIKLSTSPNYSYSLQVTGQYGQAKRTLCVEMRKTGSMGTPASDFAMAAKGGISQGGNAVNLLYNPTDGTTGVAGNVVATPSPGAPSADVIVFPGHPQSATSVDFPVVSDALYAQLNQMASSHQFTTYISGQSATSWTNVYIPPSTATGRSILTLPPILNGIIYIGWPNNVSFAPNTQLNGIIIYQKSTGTGSLSLALGRDQSFSNDVTLAQQSVSQFLGETVYAQLRSDLDGWAIIAPDTDMTVTPGNATGQKVLNASIHVKSFTGATGQGNGSDTNYVMNIGGIVAEGTISYGGNRRFAMYPPGLARGTSAPVGYTLVPTFSNYWEP